MREIFIAAALLALAACAAPTQPAAVAAAPAASAVVAADDAKVVCHRETPTGSNIAHSVCTKQDPADTKEMQDALGDIARRSRSLTQ